MQLKFIRCIINQLCKEFRQYKEEMTSRKHDKVQKSSFFQKIQILLNRIIGLFERQTKEGLLSIIFEIISCSLEYTQSLMVQNTYYHSQIRDKLIQITDSQTMYPRMLAEKVAHPQNLRGGSNDHKMGQRQQNYSPCNNTLQTNDKTAWGGSEENTGENITTFKNQSFDQNFPSKLDHPRSLNQEKDGGVFLSSQQRMNPAEIEQDCKKVLHYEIDGSSIRSVVSNCQEKVQKRNYQNKKGSSQPPNTEINQSNALPVLKQRQEGEKNQLQFSHHNFTFSSNLHSSGRQEGWKYASSANIQRDSQSQQESSFEFVYPQTISIRKSGNSLTCSGYNMFALEKILEASSLYHNYLKPLSKKLRVGWNQPQKLPQQFFYKPQRVLFKQHNEGQGNDYLYNGYHMICKMNAERTRFYYQNMKLQQLYSMNGMKISEIVFAKQQNMSKNVEYDYFNKRLFFFSNSQQRVLVYSEATQEKLCEVKVQKKVNDPHLYIQHLNNRTFMLIVGGYCKIQKEIVQGSKFIEIFQLMSWQIQLQSKIINLITGRISPIILKIKEKDKNKILILGGNTIAKMSKEGELDYEYEKDMNESTNLTGISISFRQILQLFDIKEQAICNNHSVKLLNPLSLHNGCVVSLRGNLLLLIPCSKDVFQVKMSNKEVNIIQGKNCKYLRYQKQFQQRQFCIRQHDSIVFYTINEQGLLQILEPEPQNKRKCKCIIY